MRAGAAANGRALAPIATTEHLHMSSNTRVVSASSATSVPRFSDEWKLSPAVFCAVEDRLWVWHTICSCSWVPAVGLVGAFCTAFRYGGRSLAERGRRSGGIGGSVS